MEPTAKTSLGQSPKRKWSFLRKVRYAFIFAFLAFMAFFAICIAVGVIANLFGGESIPAHTDPGASTPADLLRIQQCLGRLSELETEIQQKVQQAMSGHLDRDAALDDWGRWSTEWRQRFEHLGLACSLSRNDPRSDESQALLFQLYGLVDLLQRTQNRHVRRFVTENSVTLRNLRQVEAALQRHLDGF